jgi:hypothetical protein
MARKHVVSALLALCLASAGPAFIVPVSVEDAEASDPVEEVSHPRVSGLRSVSFGYGIDEVAFALGRELPVGAAAASACVDGSDNVVVIATTR